MYEYRAKIERVIDGDTVICLIDLGFHCYHRESIRLYGINCPEVHGDTKNKGLQAKAFTEKWVAEAAPLSDWPFILQTQKGETFGRFVADIRRASDLSWLNKELLSSGNAVELHV
jgi:micrococcal nuclease